MTSYGTRVRTARTRCASRRAQSALAATNLSSLFHKAFPSTKFHKRGQESNVVDDKVGDSGANTPSVRSSVRLQPQKAHAEKSTNKTGRGLPSASNNAALRLTPAKACAKYIPMFKCRESRTAQFVLVSDMYFAAGEKKPGHLCLLSFFVSFFGPGSTPRGHGYVELHEEPIHRAGREGRHRLFSLHRSGVWNGEDDG